MLRPIMTAPVLLLCLFLTNCVGPGVRDNILSPQISITWTEVSRQAANGGADPAAVESFARAIESKNHQQIYMQWPGIKTSAENFIETQLADGIIPPGTAESFRERIRQFDAAVEALNRRFTR